MSIAIDTITKSFNGKPAVSAVSFEVPDNAFFCIVGPSGCGKSTLLRLIAGLDRPDEGRIALGGMPVVGPDIFVPPEDRHVGVVFQSYALWPHLSVAKNVAFPYEAKGFATDEAMRRAGEHLETVALDAFAERRPEALSGGQRQRVALARCLAGNARTILMDEPLANLDPHLRGAMETELKAFHDRSGATTLYITHDQREAMGLADIMAVMYQGHMLQVGAPEEIYARPANETVACFIGRGSFIKAHVANGMARIGDQNVPVEGARDGARTVFLRPQQIIAGSAGWPVVVDAVHYRGGYWEASAYHMEGDEPIMLDLPAPVKAGERLHLTFTGGWVLPQP